MELPISFISQNTSRNSFHVFLIYVCVENATLKLLSKNSTFQYIITFKYNEALFMQNNIWLEKKYVTAWNVFSIVWHPLKPII